MRGKIQYFGPFSAMPRPPENAKVIVMRNGKEEAAIYRASYDMVAYEVGGAETVPLMLYGSSKSELIGLCE